MKSPWALLLLVAACDASALRFDVVSEAHAGAPAEPAMTPAYTLPDAQAALLSQWYQNVGSRRDGETIGELAVRAAELQLGKPYFDPPPQAGPEELRVALDTFQCVSLVESSLALARCTWLGTTDGACFLREVAETRYRGGVIDGFASRMHYFSEWMVDNATRGRLTEITALLGGTTRTYDLFYMTRHAKKYPPLADTAVLSSISEMEARLSRTPFSTLGRGQLKDAQRELQTGDVVAIVTSKPGLLISHTGFVSRKDGQAPRLLHASSHQKKVLITGDIASYVNRWPDRQGVMVARPLPPLPVKAN